MAWYKLNPMYWWKRRLFREYQRGWIAATKDPQAHLKIPMMYTYVVLPGETVMDASVLERDNNQDAG